MKTLLQRNNRWDDYVQRLLSSIVEKGSHFIASSPHPANRKVSIAGINPEFNDLVFIEHFWLDNICLIHFMDAHS